MKVIIVGGVAGGASCAARLRRLDEKAEILMVERGPYVSYANCGLPYHIGGVIEKESSLLVATEQTFRSHVRDRLPYALRGGRNLSQEENRGAQEPRNRRGDHRELRQARAVARCGSDAPAPARNRPPGDLFGEDRARREGHPGVDRTGFDALPGAHVYSGFQTVDTRPAPWWSAADSSASRWPKTSSIASSK